MKKRVICMAVAVAVLTVISSMTLVGCADKEIRPREVILEVINPNTGEVLQDDEDINLPKVKTYTEVRIKDKLTGVYLTDDDIPRNTIKGSCGIEFSVIRDYGRLSPLYTSGYWPAEVDPFDNYYKISVHFNCQPSSVVDPNYVKKYRDNTEHFYFYANR